MTTRGSRAEEEYERSRQLTEALLRDHPDRQEAMLEGAVAVAGVFAHSHLTSAKRGWLSTKELHDIIAAGLIGALDAWDNAQSPKTVPSDEDDWE